MNYIICPKCNGKGSVRPEWKELPFDIICSKCNAKGRINIDLPKHQHIKDDLISTYDCNTGEDLDE